MSSVNNNKGNTRRCKEYACFKYILKRVYPAIQRKSNYKSKTKFNRNLKG